MHFLAKLIAEEPERGTRIMHENEMNWKRRVRSAGRAALLTLAAALLLWLIFTCTAEGLKLVHARRQQDVQELLPLVPPAAVSEPVEPAPAAPAEPAEPPATEDWMLTLVNRWNPLPDDFAVETAAVEGKYQLDARAVEPLQRMLADCRADGLDPIICSAYRTGEYQTGLFDKQVRKQRKKGFADEEAVAAAAEVVAVPGTSEHQLGLAVDLCARSYQLLDKGQEDTAEFQWLREHCMDYGFILRYPDGTTDLTGIIYEPWHFRYVGEQAAREITDAGITLEEYVNEKNGAD